MSAPATYAPSPGAAPLRRMLRAQTGLEIRMVLRNGEQLLLTIVIPVLVLVVFGSLELTDLGDPDGSASTSWCRGCSPSPCCRRPSPGWRSAPASSGGTARSSGSGASPLPRAALLAAKGLAVLAVEALQVVAAAVQSRCCSGWDAALRRDAVAVRAAPRAWPARRPSARSAC